MSSIEVIPVMWVFGGWVALSVAYFVQGAARDTAVQAPSPSPFQSERASQTRRAEIARERFGSASLAYLAFANGVAGGLLYYAKAGHLWAALCCAVACLWLIYECVSTPLALRGIGAGQVGPVDWAYYLTGGAVWLYALACVLFQPLGKGG